ncbi:hypothetical protein ACWIG5_23310 [Streptomyces lydicus]
MHDNSGEPTATPHPRVCELCGTAIHRTSQVSGRVRDSSWIHPYDSEQDGERLLAACSPGHLDQLRQRYRRRPFVKEELWAGKIDRALRAQPDLDEEELADVTGLNFIQIEHALTWESERFLEERAARGGHEGPDGGSGRPNTQGLH